MKYLVCAALALSVGCGGSEKGPVSVLTPSTSLAAASPEKPADVPAPSVGPAVGPLPTVSGPVGCLSPADLKNLPGGQFNEAIWDVRVNDAGPTGLDGFLTMAHHDVISDCEPTTADPRDRIRLVSQLPLLPLAPHRSGVFRFAAPLNEWACGKVQFDGSRRPGRPEDLIWSLVYRLGVNCAPATPEPTPDPPTDPPVDPPAPPVPPQPPTPPVPPTPPPPPVPPIEPPKKTQCIPSKDVVTPTHEPFYAGGYVIFEFRVNQPDAELTLASYEQESNDDWLPQRLLDSISVRAGDTLAGTDIGTMRLRAASCNAQLDLLTCKPAPSRIVRNEDIEFRVIDSWDASPPCSGFAPKGQKPAWMGR